MSQWIMAHYGYEDDEKREEHVIEICTKWKINIQKMCTYLVHHITIVYTYIFTNN